MSTLVHVFRSSKAARRFASLALLAIAGTAALVRPGVGAPRHEGWPSVELPAGAESFEVGEQVSVNGVPLRMTAFTAPQNMASAVAWFKAQLGSPSTENRVGDRTILGCPRGEHYITVQLEADLAGVHGVIGVSDVRQAGSGQASSRAARNAWLSDLPAGTRILNHLESSEAGRSSTFLVLGNQQSDLLNIERATQALEKRGFTLQRKVPLQKGAEAQGQVVPMSGQTGLFKSADREATVLTFHDASGKASLVIHTVVFQERP